MILVSTFRFKYILTLLLILFSSVRLFSGEKLYDYHNVCNTVSLNIPFSDMTQINNYLSDVQFPKFINPEFLGLEYSYYSQCNFPFSNSSDGSSYNKYGYGFMYSLNSKENKNSDNDLAALRQSSIKMLELKYYLGYQYYPSDWFGIYPNLEFSYSHSIFSFNDNIGDNLSFEQLFMKDRAPRSIISSSLNIGVGTTFNFRIKIHERLKKEYIYDDNGNITDKYFRNNKDYFSININASYKYPIISSFNAGEITFKNIDLSYPIGFSLRMSFSIDSFNGIIKDDNIK